MTHAAPGLTARPVHLVLPAGGSANALAARLGETLKGDVIFDAASRGRFSTDASIYQITLFGTVVPRHQDDVRVAMEFARRLHIAVLARGAGTSQYGQTMGEALVIDTTKWLNKVVDSDSAAPTVTVEPGIVLDHLNTWLKPYGLSFPVDVSTDAQCTIGGMAGSNSCGSRSIGYGNMVHNVEAIDAIFADGTEARFGPLHMAPEGARLKGIVNELKGIVQRGRAEMAGRILRVLRRVAGYILDLFDCLNPRADTDDGVANLSHIIMVPEGTLAFSRQVTLKLASIPKYQTLGVVNFPTFYDAINLTQHIVKLRPVAVEPVDSTMIGLATGNPAFRPVIGKVLVGTPEAMLLVKFAGEDQNEELDRLQQLVELMGGPGFPGSVVQMPDPAEQKALWDVRTACLNITISMKGDGQAGVLHRGLRRACRTTLWIHEQADRGILQTRDRTYLVCPYLCRNLARKADPRHAARRRVENAGDCGGSVRNNVRVRGGAVLESTGMACAAGSGSPGKMVREFIRRSPRSRCSLLAHCSLP